MIGTRRHDLDRVGALLDPCGCIAHEDSREVLRIPTRDPSVYPVAI
jgi:hypothetical protein